MTLFRPRIYRDYRTGNSTWILTIKPLFTTMRSSSAVCASQKPSQVKEFNCETAYTHFAAIAYGMPLHTAKTLKSGVCIEMTSILVTVSYRKEKLELYVGDVLRKNFYVIPSFCWFVKQYLKLQLVSEDVLERLLQRSMARAESQAKNSFHCKTPDCQGWCLFEDNANEFLCPVCMRLNCITCRAIHEQLNCRQYQDRLMMLARTDEEAKKTTDAIEVSCLSRNQSQFKR